ncbi:MAG: hypothetical protein KDC66_20905 [Phaeodactylibacter sp.]|nr:hypothetical protein [Phaeodactylibacter sp.]
MQSFVIGIGGIVIMVAIWALVQSLWRDTFAENITDDDVLAGRTKCSNCGCSTVCQRDGKESSKNKLPVSVIRRSPEATERAGGQA